MRRHAWSYVVAMLGAAGVLAACGGDAMETSTVPAPTSRTSAVVSCDAYPRDGFVVEGSIEGAPGLPASVEAHVVWVVAVGDDYATTFGRGCVDAAAATYVMSFDHDPPAAALNDWRGCAVGVGAVMLFDRELSEGTDPLAGSETTPGMVLGASEDWAVIFTSGPCETVGWPGAFAGGYAVGRCERVPDDFDFFEPAPADQQPTLRVVADLDALEWCNWT